MRALQAGALLEQAAGDRTEVGGAELGQADQFVAVHVAGIAAQEERHVGTRGLVRLDTRTNRPTRVATLPGDAPERIAYLAGSLWVTGRGTDLLKVDPESGAVGQQVDIGASGIDVAMMTVERQLPRNIRIITPTSAAASAASRMTPNTAAFTKID